MLNPSVQVVKIGGSLLDLSDLPGRLRDWRIGRLDTHDVFVVGGGAPVDSLRTQPLDDVSAHWAAIEIMALNAEQIALNWPDVPVLQFGSSFRSRLAEPGATFLDIVHFVQEVEPGIAGRRLPASWETTSDAIAGRLAVTLGADELALLKSTLPCRGTNWTLADLAVAGYIDEELPRLQGELPPVSVYDLRKVPPVGMRVGDCSVPGR